jgi:MFS family permease
MMQKITKRDLSILIGNGLDHFDTSLYGFLVPILAPIFFPEYDPVVQLIMGYSIMSTSLITRPVGSFIFGVIARHYGPTFGLSYSLIGVAITTVSIGLLPGYDMLGWFAPLCLILVRMIKGIFAAGESTIAKIYILQGKSQRPALKASYWYQCSSMAGIVLASAVCTASIFFQQYEVSWRLCFWLGGLVGLIGYFLRRYSISVEEREGMKQFSSYRISSLKMLWVHRVNVSRVAICTSFSYITYAVPFVFMNSYVPLVTSITLEAMMALNTILLVFDMVMIPIVGRFVSQFESRRVMIFSSTILALTIFPLLSALQDASFVYVTFVRFWIVFWGVVFLCPVNFWYKTLFNSREQYLLIGMGNAIGAGTLGKMSSAICLGLWYTTGSMALSATYVVGVMLATSYAVWSESLKESEVVTV